MQPPVAIPWYPAKLAWQLDANRAQLRKIAALGRLHDFMKRENDAGGITRQEAVSMIPPLLLDVQPHHLVCPRPSRLLVYPMTRLGNFQPDRLGRSAHDTQRRSVSNRVNAAPNAQHFAIMLHVLVHLSCPECTYFYCDGESSKAYFVGGPPIC